MWSQLHLSVFHGNHFMSEQARCSVIGSLGTKGLPVWAGRICEDRFLCSLHPQGMANCIQCCGEKAGMREMDNLLHLGQDGLIDGKATLDPGEGLTFLFTKAQGDVL